MVNYKGYRCDYTCEFRTKHYLELKEQRGSITDEELVELEMLRKKLYKMLHRMRA